MVRRFVAWVVVTVGTAGTLFACSSSSGAPAGAAGAGGTPSDPFVGSWSCTGTSTTTYTAPAGAMPVMSATDATVLLADDGTGKVTIVRTQVDGGTMCTLHSTLGADGKSLSPVLPETCTLENGNTQTITGGGSTLAADGKSYTSSSTWTITGMNAKGEAVMGDGMGSSTCTKM